MPTRTDDPSAAGNCPSDCSLRQAVAFVQPTGGTVDLTNAPTQVTYNLTQGTLNINPASGNSIAITGPNPRLVKISDSGAAGAVINIVGQTVSISGVTITGGSGTGNGGGIVNGGSLTLNNVEITGNATSASGNVAGAGVYNNGAALTVSNSAITGNTATTTGVAPGTATGGGIANAVGGALKISNSTITGNTATTGALGTAKGGGIWQANGVNTSTVLANVTLNGNTASVGLGGTATGGNVAVDGGTAQAKDTIVAGGSAATGSNCSGTVTSLGYNLEDNHQCGFTGTGDRIDTDPQLKLGPATSGNNFTDVETVAPTSPAIDHGNPAGCTNAAGAALTTDQVANSRGTPCDIGAYETNLPPQVVTGPVISGTPQTGKQLSCAGATFSGLLPIAQSVAWLRNGVAIAGATAATYTPAAPDIGQVVSCAVTGSNVDGTATATSAAVSVSLPPLPAFTGVTLLKTRFTVRNGQVILPVMCSRVAIFGCGGIVKVSVAGTVKGATAAARKKRRKPTVPHPSTLGAATFKLNNSQTGTIPVLISHDGKLEIASRPHGRQAVTIQILAYDGLGRQKLTSYRGQITAPASTTKKSKRRTR